MFVGHFAVGFGLKRATPAVSLGVLFFATQFVDLLWPTLLLMDLEHVAIAPGITAVTPLDFFDYPISHSLLAVCGWAVLIGGACGLWRRQWLTGLLCGSAVLSHWFLDLITHRPDLPLTPGGAARVGLGLWSSLPATLVVELGLFALGVALYARSTRALNRKGSLGLWALVGFLLVVHLGNMFGPPPPSVDAIAISGHAQWLLVLWAWWLDRHRVGRSA
ncbi:MAG: hypothetical protein HN404_26825 [Gemmatimonadetes bacterium]|jgi:hypothetical protein|nr:hypothetical protein [Gemmatimonadota bacterium]